MDTLRVLADAFHEFRPQLFVADSEARRTAGFWSLDQQIPTPDIISLMNQSPQLKTDRVLYLPTHQLETAELTGHYLRCRDPEGHPQIEFFDFARQATVSLELDEFSQTTLALHVRFWHPHYPAPETPSYLTAPQALESQPAHGRDNEAPEMDEDIFNYARLFIEQDRETDREDRRTRYQSLSHAAFFDQHNGIPEATAAGRYADRDGGQICKLKISTDDPATTERASEESNPQHHGLEPGAEVIVDTQSSIDGFPVDAEVVDLVDGTEIHLRIKWSTSRDHAAAETAFAEDSTVRFVIAELLNPRTYTRARSAVDDIERHERKQELVAGSRSPTFEDPGQFDGATQHLDQYQTTAVKKALASDEYLCIHGAPGTGKTRVATILAREAAKRGNKVLACAPSQAGVDQLLVGNSTPDRIDPKSPHADAMNDTYQIGYTGTPTRSIIVDNYSDVDAWEANVVGSTPMRAHQFREDEFDLVILDDAHRCTVPESFIPYSKGERLVLIGDDNLLPPRPAHESDDTESIDLSLFEYFTNQLENAPVESVLKQYRMNEAIAAFPNKEFYGGNLDAGQRNRRWRIRDEDPIKALDIQGEEERTPGGSYYNITEANAVVRELSRLLHRGVSPTQIGVITPFSGQVGMITKILDDQSLRDRLTIGTLEAIPPVPFDVVILSFVRSNPTGDTGMLSFPNEGPRRLNAMLTRAKKHLVLIGDWDTLCSGSDRDPDGSEVFNSLYDHLDHQQHLASNPPA